MKSVYNIDDRDYQNLDYYLMEITLMTEVISRKKMAYSSKELRVLVRVLMLLYKLRVKVEF